MKKLTITVVTVCFAALIHGSCIGAYGETKANQQPLPKFVNPARASLLAGPSGFHPLARPPAAPAAPYARFQVRGHGPVFIGGPPGSRKNVAVSGQLYSFKNAVAISGIRTSRRRD